MAYQSNKPQAADALSTSQSDILGNFTAIKTLVDINHETFDIPNQGKHAKVDLTDQSAAVPTSAANEVTLYSNAGDLCLSKNGGTEINFTSVTAHTAPKGHEVLPSGLIINWGTISMGVGTASASLTLSKSITTMYSLTYGALSNNPNITVAANAVITAKTLTGGGTGLQLTRGKTADSVEFNFLLIGK